MSKRLLGWIVLLLLVGVGGHAFALSTTPSSPIDIGTTLINTTVSRTIAIDGTNPPEILDRFEMTGAACPRFTLTPAAALPQTLGNGQSLNVDVDFTPTARGAVQCDVTMRGPAPTNANLGTFRITGTGTGPIIGVTPAAGPVDFGSARVLDSATGSTTTQTFVVANTGDAGSTLIVNAPTFTGANPANFSVTSPATFPQNVAAGSNLDIVVQFNPSAAGTRTATINIASNGGATYTAGLTGVGTNAVIGVTSSSTFTNVAAFATGTITVANTGAAPQGPLRVATGTIAGGDGWFTFEDNGLGCSGATCTFNTTVTSGSPLPVNVRCTPQPGAIGQRTATVSFTSDTDAGGDNNVSLTCTGRAEHTIDTTMLAFGSQLVNTSSAPRTVTVTNVGTNIDLVFTVTKSPVGAPFSLGGCATSCTVPAGESRQFTVTFTPTAANQDVTATLTVVDNDLDADSTIALSGRGVAPQIGPPVSVEFGSIEVGKMGQQTLTITNTGEAPLTISNAILSADATDYTVLSGMSGAQMTIVDPGLTTSWTLSCNPTAMGDVPGTFNISSNAFSAPSISVPLNCTGLQGVLVAIGTPIDFGNVNEMDTPPDRSFTLRNAGNLQVSNIAVVVQPAVGYFTVLALPQTTLLPNTQMTVTVRYRPITGTDDGPVSLVFSGQWGTDNSPIPPLSVTVQGNALLNGFDLTPTTLAFGDIRFDRPATGTFCVQVTGESTFDVTMINVSPAAGTMSGEVAITKIRRLATCGAPTGTDVGTTLPQRIGPSATAMVLEITVRVAPANRLGPVSATITVLSNLPGPLSRMMTVTANSTSAMLAIDPGTNIDFGPVDVQSSTSEMRRITITNMGQATLDLTTFTRTNVTGDPSTVTFTVPPNASLQPNQSVVVDVTYKPNIVEPVEVHLGHQIAGVFGGPTTGNIVIKGRGIDRNFMLLSDSETFPATFRNPGSMAPVKPIKVRNLGEAPLAITAVMITDGDPEIWQLVDPSPVTIPGLGEHDFQVKFLPKVSGAMDTAVLQLMHDDDMAPMTPLARVPLSGLSIDRMANFTTDVIRLGYTGVGIPYRFDGIEIQSMDPANKFTIRQLTYDDNGGLFEVDDISNTELAPSGTVSFGVTFSPTVAGSSFTEVELFLDEDPLPQGRVVRIEGDAVFVDAHGGGGCSTRGGAGGGMLLLLLAVLGGRVRRRVWPALAVILAIPFAVRADNVVLSVFDPTPSTTAHGFQVASPEVGDDGEWVASAVASYATDQFIHDAYLQDGVLLNGHGAVRQSSMMLLGGAYALRGKFELGARMPLYSQSGDALGDRTMAYPGDPVAGTARGDLTLHGKMQLVKKQLEGKGLFALGPALHLTLPTASDDQFTGIDKPSVRGLLLATLRPGAFDNRVTFTMNAGFIGRATARYANLEQKSGGTWGLGLSVRALERLWLAGEMFGDLIPSGNQRMEDAGKTVLQPIEWLVGARWLPDHRVAVGLAAGRGLTSSAGSPALRGVLTLTFAPGAEKPPRMRIPVADLDSDEDGLRDSVDRCKFEAEDKDQFQDDDGCVDADNDGDKIADAQDKCPIEAEDVDGFQDADGCVDKDNDRDGVADGNDKCKDYPEDKDGFEDVDGCPELDNDRDGIPDASDGCINDPEAINGNKDDDGCPDSGDSLVVLSPDRIELLDTIKFTNGTKLARGSFNVLGQVAATLRAHPEIIRMRVTVHVHDSGNDGNDKKDQELSDKRAQAVREWIVQWGIPASRVEARGFGSAKMLGRSAQINDRVELIILERK